MARGQLNVKLRLLDADAVLVHMELPKQLICVCKQGLICDGHAACGRLYNKIAVKLFNFLDLRRIGTVRKNNTVSAEVVVVGPVVKIPAVSKEFLTVAVSGLNGLIDISPDKSALVPGLCAGKVRIFEQVTAGVAHSMGIFAADKRFLGMLLQELLDIRSRGVHLAFHVGGIVEPALVENALIVHKARIIMLAEVLRHIKDILTAAALVTA